MHTHHGVFIMKKVSKFLLVVSVIFLLAILFKFILYPAYLSYASVCDEETFSKTGAIVVGLTSTNLTTNETTISFVEGYEKNPLFVKHELVHYWQHTKGYFSSCGQPVRFFMREVQAYFWQYMPDWAFGVRFG